MQSSVLHITVKRGSGVQPTNYLFSDFQVYLAILSEG